ncbi:hypothetical protein FQN60_016772, partial [Etheostoma spectabile]
MSGNTPTLHLDRIPPDTLKKVQRYLEPFRLSQAELQEVSARLSRDLVLENGDFLALDLGGTNFRVLHVRVVEEEQRVLKMDSQICAIPKEMMLGTGEQSILIRWTKGFNCSGVEGKDVVKLLRDAVHRRGVSTGTNACYMEEMENVERGEDGRMCINTEWGGFGDDGSLRDIRTEFDVAVDETSINPGVHIFEKMISGMYLGEIVRLLLLGLKADSVDCGVVRLVCDAVSSRSAGLCAAALATVANRIRSNRGLDHLKTTVGVDGTVYRKHP